MISCNITYYNEPHFLSWWYNTFKAFYEQGADIELNIADDGSMRQSAESFFDKKAPMPNMRLFRVLEDIGFNSHGARNLLMKQTRTEWNMLSDIDRRYPVDTFKDIMVREPIGKLKTGAFYPFQTLKREKEISLNEYVVSKTDFWNAGGYDEEFVNIHWGDRVFIDCLTKIARRSIVPEWKVKYVRGARKVTYTDVATTQYPDDKTLIHPNGIWTNQETRLALKSFVSKRNSTQEGRQSKKVINFEWKQVF